jgi:hypothetical protein
MIAFDTYNRFGFIIANLSVLAAMNPMLATAWCVFGVGKKYEFPADMNHYTVYWIAPGLAAILASSLYVVYAGGTMWGMKLPIGPLKPASIKTTKKD